jgi:hypothetical protein
VLFWIHFAFPMVVDTCVLQPPIATSGETASSPRVFLKGPMCRDFWCVVRVEPWVFPCANSTIKTFRQSCVKLLNDPSYVKVLKNMLERCSTEEERKLEQKIVNHLHMRRRTSREFRLNENIGNFNMGDIILDLGSEVIVLPKKTWKCMGETTLGYLPIQLKLANQHIVVPIGRLKCMKVDLDGVCTKANFEVIEILEGTTPYPRFLGMVWAFDKQDIINMRTRKMKFESGDVGPWLWKEVKIKEAE